MSGPEPSETPLNLELEWQRWPLVESGQQGLLRAGAVLLLLALVGLVLTLSLPPLTATLLTLLLTLALVPYFVPRRYQVSEAGLVVIRGFFTERREWSEFRFYRPGRQGYWLLPDTSRSVPGKLPGRTFFLPYPLDRATGQSLERQLSSRLKPSLSD